MSAREECVMTRDEIVAFFAARQGPWAARDADALAACNAVNGTVASPMFKHLNGRKAIAGSYRRLFEIFPDWDYQSDGLIVDDDRVAQPFVATATHRGELLGIAGTGHKCRIEGVRLFRMQDGLIQDERRVYDFTSLLMQIGLLRAKGV